jgi:hypothetical protein
MRGTSRRRECCKSTSHHLICIGNSPSACSIALSDTGWTNDLIGAEWFRKCFIPQAKERNVTGKEILLMYDGHHSHDTLEIRKMAVQSNVELFKIPAHTTHRLQPLDVGVFDPLQQAWLKQCLSVLDETGQGITQQQLV